MRNAIRISNRCQRSAGIKIHHGIYRFSGDGGWCYGSAVERRGLGCPLGSLRGAEGGKSGVNGLPKSPPTPNRPILGLSLALIGNASGQSVGVEWDLDPRRFRSRLVPLVRNRGPGTSHMNVSGREGTHLREATIPSSTPQDEASSPPHANEIPAECHAQAGATDCS